MRNNINDIDVLYYTIKAMRALVPDAKINISFKDKGKFDYSGITIENGYTMPSEEEILNKIDDLYDADTLRIENTKYQKDRQKEYPTIGDQLDALFHAGVFPAEMAEQIQAIKNKYPKE
jgi:hypothetical protein